MGQWEGSSRSRTGRAQMCRFVRCGCRERECSSRSPPRRTGCELSPAIAYTHVSFLSASNIIWLCLASLEGLGKLCQISSKLLCQECEGLLEFDMQYHNSHGRIVLNAEAAEEIG